MEHIASERITWKAALKKERPLLMPVAHDGLSAKLIEAAGFTAVQVGGFAVAGARHGLPDVDLTHYAERHAAVKDIMSATSLPILVDADDGYGDVKNVTHTVRGYMALGIQGLFIEDQQAPKECGHMDDKKVVPVEQMVAKVKAAVAARDKKDFFILARTRRAGPRGRGRRDPAGGEVPQGRRGRRVRRGAGIGRAAQAGRQGVPRRAPGDEHPRERRQDPMAAAGGVRGDGLYDAPLPDDPPVPRRPAPCSGPPRTCGRASLWIRANRWT